MKTFEFSIIASGVDPHADDFESRFYEAGCDDALVAYQKGCIIIDFAREAESADAAISAAVANVQSAGAIVEHVEPDPLVSLSDIAQRAGLTKAAVYNYTKGERRSEFPAPVARITTGSPLWDWADVSCWLYQQGVIAIDAWSQAIFVKNTNVRLRAEAANRRSGCLSDTRMA